MKKIVATLLTGLILVTCTQPIEASAAQGQAGVPTITVKVVAGHGQPGYSNGSSAESGIFNPMGMAYGADGTLYFADSGNNLIRREDKGTVSTIAGISGIRNLYGEMVGGYVDDKKESSMFQKPTDVVCKNGITYITDSMNHSIRRIENGRVYTLAGGNGPGYADGNYMSAKFNTPHNIALDENGVLYVSDTENNVIRRIDAGGNVTTIAGVGGTSGYRDGDAGTALFNRPMGIACKDGSIYVADSGNNRIRKIEKTTVTTVAGAGTELYEDTGDYVGGYLDGEALTARFNYPTNLAFHNDGSMFITDTDNSMIRKLQNGQVTTMLSGETVVNNNPELIQKFLAQPSDIIARDNALIISDSFTQYIYSITLE